MVRRWNSGQLTISTRQVLRAAERSVGQVLSDAGARYVLPVVLDQHTRALLARASSLPGNEHLADVAARGQVDVDVSQLIHSDPAAEVIVGFELAWTEEEADRFDLHDRGPGG
jgi:hypothetical protein